MGALVSFHSYWRWAVLVLLLAAAARYSIALLRAGSWTSFDRRLARLATVFVDVQVLSGLIVWLGTRAWTSGAFNFWIHPLVMLAAAGAVHMARARSRAAVTDGARFKAGAAGLWLALLLIVLGIPRGARGV
jgi:hypothetical protein